MKTSTIETSPISTTDLITYDGEYKTDFDKFRDMSGLAQGAIIATGVVAAGAVVYGVYKGVKYMRENRLPYNPYFNPMYPQQNQYYPQANLPQSAVNIQGQYGTNENNQPTVTFQANSTPVAPQMQYQQPTQAQQYQRIVLPNGQVQDVPVNPQPVSPIYQSTQTQQ